jgi:hypothetical protein
MVMKHSQVSNAKILHSGKSVDVQMFHIQHLGSI